MGKDQTVDREVTFDALVDWDRAPSRAPTLGKSSSLGDVVRAAIADGLDRLLRHDWALRAAGSEPAVRDVHQSRVAARRLRSHLKLFRDALDPIWVAHARDDLAWLGTALGDVRDADVLAERFESAPAPLRASLADERRRAAGRLGAVLASERYLDLLDRLHAAGGSPPFLSVEDGVRAGDRARDVVPGLVGNGLRSVRRQVRKAGRHPTDRQLHRIRIKSKQVRYAAELVTPVIGRPAGRTAAAAEDLQTVLGEQHDAVEAEAWLHEWARRCDATPDGSGPASLSLFEAGRLSSDERRRQRRLRARWRRSWKALATAKRSGWVR